VAVGSDVVVIPKEASTQAAALVDPEFGLTVPTGQGVAALAPTVATYVLGGARVQLDAPAVEL
jgi:hypothetical protein